MFCAALRAQNADEGALRRVNLEYIAAFLHSDVAAYRTLLAPNFQAVLADGSLVDKATFLAMAAQPAPVTDFDVREISIRQFGDAAVISGRVTYLGRAGNRIARRYVDVYIRAAGTWRAVSAQLTPL
jgi:ketosteroid isomerase-like protein